jgi:hypothetical protein
MISTFNLSQKALTNASKFDWDLKEKFTILRKLKIPQKIKNTWYQILHNSLKVMSNIHSENHSKKCPLCGNEKENIPHLLSRCRTTKFLQLPNWHVWPKNSTELADKLTTHYLIWKTRCEISIGNKTICKKQTKEALKQLKEFNSSLSKCGKQKSS